MQKAIETYDNMAHLAGIEIENKETLAPVGHIIAKASILITIKSNGEFISADKIVPDNNKKDKKIPIPATEDSAGRTSKKTAPHVLCDKLEYICLDDSLSNDNKVQQYTEQLEEWANSEFSHPKIKAVLKYVKSGTLKHDLLSNNLLKIDSDGKIKNTDDIICWSVADLDSPCDVWKDIELHKLFYQFYISKLVKERKKSLCMISGNETICAQICIKGVLPRYGNAKLISSNDDDNFTYLGRFTDNKEAFGIGYEQSQKGLNALRWVNANQGIIVGKRAFVCWNPKGKPVPKANLPLSDFEEEPAEPSDYKKELGETVKQGRTTLEPDDEIIIAAFDSPTEGRMSVLYYNELRCEDFFNRLKAWDETCCWVNYNGDRFVPNLNSIVKYAFGVQKSGKSNKSKDSIEVNEKTERQIMLRLIFCRLEKQIFPSDIMKALVSNASNLKIYSDKNRSSLLKVACAVIKKYHYDKYKEEWKMSLEKDKPDRSYQFGRLLAVLEKIESDTFKEDDEKRETNALRLQSVFTQRPAYASKIIIDNLKNAYYLKLNPGNRIYYENLIGEIFENLSQFSDEEYNKPLKETYLLGYYLQKNDLYKKKETITDTEVKNNE